MKRIIVTKNLVGDLRKDTEAGKAIGFALEYTASRCCATVFSFTNFKTALAEVTTAGILFPVLLFIVLSIFLTISSGCEGAKPKQRPGADPSIIQITPATTTPEATKPEDKNPADQPKTEEPKPTPKEVTEAKTEPQKNVEANKPERVVNAEVGAGAKGHYGGEKTVMAPILVPLSVHWRVAEMTTYNIKIPKAMQLYKANHDNKAPATHEEFMEEIIKKEAIKLPQLPAGHRYVYDPTDEQLKIAKPAN